MRAYTSPKTGDFPRNCQSFPWLCSGLLRLHRPCRGHTCPALPVRTIPSQDAAGAHSIRSSESSGSKIRSTHRIFRAFRCACPEGPRSRSAIASPALGKGFCRASRSIESHAAIAPIGPCRSTASSRSPATVREAARLHNFMGDRLMLDCRPQKQDAIVGRELGDLVARDNLSGRAGRIVVVG